MTHNIINCKCLPLALQEVNKALNKNLELETELLRKDEIINKLAKEVDNAKKEEKKRENTLRSYGDSLDLN